MILPNVYKNRVIESQPESYITLSFRSPQRILIDSFLFQLAEKQFTLEDFQNESSGLKSQRSGCVCNVIASSPIKLLIFKIDSFCLLLHLYCSVPL